jgi:hypothetical protein
MERKGEISMKAKVDINAVKLHYGDMDMWTSLSLGVVNWIEEKFWNYTRR